MTISSIAKYNNKKCLQKILSNVGYECLLQGMSNQGKVKIQTQKPWNSH
jgi:hypothetical protein